MTRILLILLMALSILFGVVTTLMFGFKLGVVVALTCFFTGIIAMILQKMGVI